MITLSISLHLCAPFSIELYNHGAHSVPYEKSPVNNTVQLNTILKVLVLLMDI